jgi:hypothetical protein
VKDRDLRRAGRVFSQAAVELALTSYPGATLTSAPGDASPFAVFSAETIGQGQVAHVAVLPSGEEIAIVPPKVTETRPAATGSETHPGTSRDTRIVKRAPLGTIIGARAGDKGGDANVGLWARTDAAYEWLRATITIEKLRELLPETHPLDVERHELPNLRAINFVIHDLLGDGVGGSTRFDPQAKALGEVLRGRFVDIPVDLQ